MSSKVAVPFCIPPAMNESHSCFISLSAFCVFSALDVSRSNRYIVVSHGCFNQHFSDACDVKHTFTCLFVICIFFG